MSFLLNSQFNGIHHLSSMDKKARQKELKRRNIINSFERIEEFLINYDEDRDSLQLEVRLERLETLMGTFEGIQSEYETLDDSEEFQTENMAVRANIEESYYRIKGGLMAKIPNTDTRTIQPHSAVPTTAYASSLKLPTIMLPQFEGDLDQWLTFHDSFLSLIHSSNEIPSIQKFQYLRSALRGDALKVIESLTISATNYSLAWEALLKRYSNKYLLKKKHLQALTSPYKSIGKSSSSLRTTVEEFERHTKILAQLGEPTAQWSTLLVHLLCSRLDEQTLKEWEQSISDDVEPTYENLISFLTRKIRTLESLFISRQQQNLKPPIVHTLPLKQQNKTTTRVNSYSTTEDYQPKCIASSEHHLLIRCPTFGKLRLEDRLTLVNNKSLQ